MKEEKLKLTIEIEREKLEKIIKELYEMEAPYDTEDTCHEAARILAEALRERDDKEIWCVESIEDGMILTFGETKKEALNRYIDTLEDFELDYKLDDVQIKAMTLAEFEKLPEE